MQGRCRKKPGPVPGLKPGLKPGPKLGPRPRPRLGLGPGPGPGPGPGLGRYLGASRAGSVVGAGAGAAGPTPPPSGAEVVSGAGLLIDSVIIPMVQPLALSRMASSALTALTYFVLSSASKKMTGGPCVASLLFARR